MKHKKKYEYKGISKRAQNLLNRIEDYDVEFKETVKSLETEDLVAFANSDEGGAILIGVRQTKEGKGKIIGCPVGDEEKVTIINKAESCFPPIDIEIFRENTGKKPFFRIEIHDCKNKPYSTSSGIYKIRGDGRNKALLPGRLLTMFVEIESKKFIERYRKATDEIEKRMNSLIKKIDTMSNEIEEKLLGILAHAEDAASFSEDSFTTSEDTFGLITSVDDKINDLYSIIQNMKGKIDALIIEFKIEPFYSKLLKFAKRKIKESAFILDLDKGNQKFKKDEILNNLRSQFPWVSDEKLEEWFREGIKEFKKTKRKTNT